jgi:hypothetical protein
MKQLPIIYKSKVWVKRNFGVSDEDIESMMSNPSGEVAVALLHSGILLDILSKINTIESFMGISGLDMSDQGTRLHDLLHSLMYAHGGFQRGNLDELCTLISRMSIMDFKVLQDFWGFKETPGQVLQVLQTYIKDGDGDLPVSYIPAIEKLRWILLNPSPTIPTCG